MLKASGQNECVGKSSTRCGEADEGGGMVLGGGEGRTSLQGGASLCTAHTDDRMATVTTAVTDELSHGRATLSKKKHLSISPESSRR